MNGSTATGGLLGRLRTEAPKLPDALRRVAELVLEAPLDAAGMSIVDLAEGSGTSPATVTRFCREMGYSGCAALRVAVAAEVGTTTRDRWATDVDPTIEPGQPVERVLEVIAAADTRAIGDTAYQVDTAAVDRIATAIAAAPRVELCGMGSSGTAAREMALRLERIRVPSRFRADAHTALTNAALLAEGDVAIGISHSGRTREVVETLAEAGSRGALTVAITSFRRSPLAATAAVLLSTQGFESTFRLAALSALHSQLLLLDLIYVAVAQRSYDRTVEAFELTARAVDPHRIAESRRGRRAPHR